MAGRSINTRLTGGYAASRHRNIGLSGRSQTSACRGYTRLRGEGRQPHPDRVDSG
jgi:hypothetical protein